MEVDLIYMGGKILEESCHMLGIWSGDSLLILPGTKLVSVFFLGGNGSFSCKSCDICCILALIQAWFQLISGGISLLILWSWSCVVYCFTDPLSKIGNLHWVFGNWGQWQQQQSLVFSYCDLVKNTFVPKTPSIHQCFDGSKRTSNKFQIQQSIENSMRLYLRKLLELLDTQVWGSVQCVLWEISWMKSEALMKFCCPEKTTHGRLGFPWGRYPFLLNAGAKRRLLSFDVDLRSQVASQEIWAKTMRSLSFSFRWLMLLAKMK